MEERVYHPNDKGDCNWLSNDDAELGTYVEDEVLGLRASPGSKKAIDPLLDADEEGKCKSTQEGKSSVPLQMVFLLPGSTEAPVNDQISGLPGQHYDMPDGCKAGNRNTASRSRVPRKRKADVRATQRRKIPEYLKPAYEDKESEKKRKSCVRSHEGRVRAAANLKKAQNESESLQKLIDVQDIIIAEKDNEIVEKDNKIAEMDNKIDEMGEIIAQKDNTIAEQKITITTQANAIARWDDAVCELENLLKK